MLESDGRCVYANSAFEQLSGYTFPELAAMETVLELVGEARSDRGPQSCRARCAAATAGSSTSRSARTSLDIEGRRQHVVVVRDVTARQQGEAERERLLARAALLAEASELFDRSLDEELTLRRVAQLCVRDMAETCVIVLGDAPERVRGVAAAARDDEREDALMAALLRDPLGEPIGEVMRGAPGLVAATPAGLGTARSVIVPLRARGRALGVLAAGFDDLSGSSDEEALALFEDLARRAALAIDNARLYAERDQVARTLQRSLLPGALPEIPGVELAGRYVAAGEGNEVGGDFYDCFATGGGDWALVIGDVCGKGAEAATPDRARPLHAARRRPAHAPPAGRPARAQRGAAAGSSSATGSAPCSTRRSRRATAASPSAVATGGHPLPMVLRAGGTVETVGAPGSLVGILDEPEITEQSVELGPGDALVLVTDGVTEATAADRATGPGRLAALLAGCAGAGAGAIADAVERDALESQGGAARDDVAVLVARAVDGGLVCRPDGRGSGSDVKLLVVTPEPVDANLLRSTLGDEVEGAEVLVISPATNESPLAFWVSDSDEAIHEAEVAQEETVERLEEEGIDAAGDTGESEPAVAIQDALATFEADRIVIFSHTGETDYREEAGSRTPRSASASPSATRRSLGSARRSPPRRPASRTGRSPSTARAGAGTPCGRPAARAPR